MSDIVTIRPAPGRKVRKQNGQVLAADGEQVVWNSHWLRQQRAGDIERVQDPVADIAQETSDQVDVKSNRKSGQAKQGVA